MRSIQSSILALSFGFLLLSCQGEERISSETSGPLGLSAGGCKSDAINALTSDRTLLSLCGQIARDNGKGNYVAAGIAEYRALARILSSISPGDAVVLEQAFCALMSAESGFECPPWTSSAITAGQVAIVVTESSAVDLATPSGEYAVTIHWQDNASDEFGVSLTQLPHVPSYTGDCTALDANAQNDCGDVPGVELLMHPIANFVPFPVADSRIGICTSGTERIGTDDGAITGFPPQATAPPGLTGCPATADVGGFRGLVQAAVEPFTSIFEVSSLYGGLTGASLLHGSPYQGQTTLTRLGSIEGTACSVFDRISGAEVTLKQAGVTVATALTDGDGHYAFSNVEIPDELANVYRVEVFRNENLSGADSLSLSAASRNGVLEFDLQPPGHGGTTSGPSVCSAP